MQFTKSTWRKSLVVGTAVCLSYLSFNMADTGVTPAIAAGKTYTGTVYVAGHGGHFAQADVTLDSSNEATPVKINSLDKIDIGTSKTHMTHDARIDAVDRNILYWSTYKLDPQGKQHVGKSDLKTGKVLIDIAMDPDPRATGGEKQMPLYCASGQSKKFYMPVFMGAEAYVDVLDKATLEKKHRVFVSDLGYAKGSYQFLHGINSPDNKTFLLALNLTKEGKGTGDIDFVLVDMAALEDGKFKEIKRNTLKGAPGKTITFREYFSNDGKFIYQSAGDRLWVIDAATLQLVDEKMLPEGLQVHDAMPTPDGKVALLTVRNLEDACDSDGKPIVKNGENTQITDGTFMLYDAAAKKLNNKTVSTCFACHKDAGLGDKNAVLCGLDANWKN
jgi:hypothetical protein